LPSQVIRDMTKFDLLFEKWEYKNIDDYMEKNQWLPIVRLRKIFPHYRIEDNILIVSTNTDEFNNQVSANFPVRLWYKFSSYQDYYRRIIYFITFKDLNSIITFLDLIPTSTVDSPPGQVLDKC
jgi:hypothetical protein